MLKGYKYRIYPNKQQGKQIQKTFGCCRFVYNQTLAYRKDKWLFIRMCGIENRLNAT